jgi:hypothetical protein
MILPANHFATRRKGKIMWGKIIGPSGILGDRSLTSGPKGHNKPAWGRAKSAAKRTQRRPR